MEAIIRNSGTEIRETRARLVDPLFENTGRSKHTGCFLKSDVTCCVPWEMGIGHPLSLQIRDSL